MSFGWIPLVLAFALASTIAAALLFGVLPAWQVTRNGAGASLKEQSRSATGSVARTRSGRLLVSVQLALSLPLLVGAGLLTRTITTCNAWTWGFRRNGCCWCDIDPREAGYDAARRSRLAGELRREIQKIPGVQAVSFSQLGLFSGGTRFQAWMWKATRQRKTSIGIRPWMRWVRAIFRRWACP